MRKFGVLTAIAVTLSTSVTAQSVEAPIGESGWGGAQWGMGVKDVLAAVGSEAQPIDLKDKGKWVWKQRQGVAANTQLLGYSYLVEYHFTPKGDKLSIIGINSEEEAACNALEDYFKTHLGEGTVKSERFELQPERFLIIGGREWGDTKNGNRYAFTSITSEPKVLTYCKVLLQDPSVKFDKK